MADRCRDLGPFGLYDDEMVNRIGMRAALEGTARHLEFGIDHLPGQKQREDARMEVNRLRSRAAQEPLPREKAA